MIVTCVFTGEELGEAARLSVVLALGTVDIVVAGVVLTDVELVVDCVVVEGTVGVV